MTPATLKHASIGSSLPVSVRVYPAISTATAVFMWTPIFPQVPEIVPSVNLFAELDAESLSFASASAVAVAALRDEDDFGE